MKSLNILVVDDEADVRSLLVEFLEMITNGQVNSAPSARAAQDILRSTDEPIDVVISDIRMPEMNGIELAEYIKQRYPKTKIVLMTGYADISEEECLAKGIYGLLKKPFALEELELLLENLKN